MKPIGPRHLRESLELWTGSPDWTGWSSWTGKLLDPEVVTSSTRSTSEDKIESRREQPPQLRAGKMSEEIRLH